MQNVKRISSIGCRKWHLLWFGCRVTLVPSARQRVRRSKGEHAAGWAQQLVPGCHPDGRPVLLHQPVLHSHRGHPPSGLRPSATSGPAPGTARGAAARSDARQGRPARATQPTHQHGSVTSFQREEQLIFCLCSPTKAGSVRLFNVTVMYGHDPVETHLCVRVWHRARYANLTATHWSLWFLPQGTCT